MYLCRHGHGSSILNIMTIFFYDYEDMYTTFSPPLFLLILLFFLGWYFKFLSYVYVICILKRRILYAIPIVPWGLDGLLVVIGIVIGIGIGILIVIGIVILIVILIGIVIGIVILIGIGIGLVIGIVIGLVIGIVILI